MTSVKICGITNLEDALLAVDLGAACLGFVMAPESPRHVDVATVRDICLRLPARVGKVAVTVNRARDDLQAIIQECPIDILQLHGEESPELSIRLGVHRIWKAFALQSSSDVEAALAYPARAILLDTAHGGRRGGTGKVGNWELAACVACRRRTVLAGGLNPENVAAAIRAVKPWMIDVSSGVELRPGRKDPDRLRALMAAVHGA